MKLVWDDAAIGVVANALDLGGFGEARGAVIRDRRGKSAACLVFHNWNPKAGLMEVSAVAKSPRWATRAVLRDAFGYIYDTSGCQLAVARTDTDNHRVRRLWRAFGADEYVIPRLRGRNASEAILTLTQEAWAASRFMM